AGLRIGAGEVGGGQVGQAPAHRGDGGPGESGTVGDGGLGGRELRGDRRFALGKALGQGDDLRDLLVGEGEPFGKVGRKVCFEGDIVRDVLQRRGGAHGQGAVGLFDL